ncbi:MAG: pyrroline-5-carboxylate reductase [Chlamydiia bacterium]|nr:pyrroline-5-carboxylate reductase [Chlamydiia bacterium]
MKVGIVGCGVMGSAMARMISENHEVTLFSRNKKGVQELAKEIGAQAALSIEDLGKQCEAVVLAVKPKDLEEVAEDLDPAITKGTLLLSILVGTPTSRLGECFSNAKVFSLMPNLPLLCGKGLIAIAETGEELPEEKEKVNQILKGLGTTFWLSEKLINPFAALTGSNPAFIYLIVEAMVQAGITMGFNAKLSEELVLKTIEGSIELLQYTGDSPSALQKAISSPGGTTIAGLNQLEKRGVRYGILSAILKTLERGKEMED